MIKGIDVSSYQGEIDFEQVKQAGNEFVIIRAGWGNSAVNKDRFFERNYAAAKAAGLFVGAYWYSYADSVSGAFGEAAACMNVIAGKQFELPIFYDVEEPFQFSKGRNFCSELVRNFCNTMQDGGYFTGLYMARFFVQTYITREVANAYALWIAEYGDRLNYSGNYGIWQYTGSGSVSGVPTIVDKNYCYINYPEIIKNAGLNGFGEPTSPLKPITEVALEVIRGDWGNGEERKIRLTEAGYDYYAVQREVERILSGENGSSCP